MSIVMFGLNIGASLIPYLVSFSWDNGAGAITLPVTIMISHLAPIPCQWFIRRCTVSYSPLRLRSFRPFLFVFPTRN